MKQIEIMILKRKKYLSDRIKDDHNAAKEHEKGTYTEWYSHYVHGWIGASATEKCFLDDLLEVLRTSTPEKPFMVCGSHPIMQDESCPVCSKAAEYNAQMKAQGNDGKS